MIRFGTVAPLTAQSWQQHPQKKIPPWDLFFATGRFNGLVRKVAERVVKEL